MCHVPSMRTLLRRTAGPGWEAIPLPWAVPRDGRVESDCSLPVHREHVAVDRTCWSLGSGSGAEEPDGSTGCWTVCSVQAKPIKKPRSAAGVSPGARGFGVQHLPRLTYQKLDFALWTDSPVDTSVSVTKYML